MIKLLLTMWLVVSISAGFTQNIQKMHTNQPDSVVISHALEEHYFKGIYNGNLESLKRIFYPGALLFGDVKGQPYAKTLEQYLDAVKNRKSPKETGTAFKGEIIKISIVNSIALAEVKVKMYDFYYHEFLSFHKIDGTWYLVNKMMSDVSKP